MPFEHPAMSDILAKLQNVRRSGEGWTARCPDHDDQENSLSIHHREGKWLLWCHAGCDWRDILNVLSLDPSELFDDGSPGRGGGVSYPPNNRATVQPLPGLTLEQYAAAKKLPLELLKSFGLSELSYQGPTAVRIPYLGEGGELLAVRFRIALEGDRFRWKSGAKPCLYGLNRIGEARAAGQVVLVEGESDCHTFWFHNIPALGLPGAANWREDQDAKHFDGIEIIYIVVEPDRGGDAVRQWLSRSTIRSRARLVTLSVKDPSALHLESPDEFKRRWQVACLGALPWVAAQAEASVIERSDAWEQCSELARSPSILDEFARELGRIGVVGERRGAKLIYLAATSRLLERPVSVAVKGPSSGGKSFLVESTLKFFPQQAYHSLTAMSERSLAYSTEPLQHKMLVIYEAAGMASEFASYLIRSLLSEGRIRYETVEKTKEGLVPRVIEREGPTGLIVTTTSLRLHPENETRMLSLTITDTREQTAAVFQALARDVAVKVDLSRWHALQTWLSTGPQRVVIPFADRLAALVPPISVRLRRDFKTVLMLIKAHALLHQASREADEQGGVVASLEDYAQMRELIASLIAEGVEARIKREVREVVEVVARVLDEGAAEVRQSDLVNALRLDKSVISRRVAAALDIGLLRNLEDRKGRPARLVLGDPVPPEVEVLPSPERLDEAKAGADPQEALSSSDERLHGCTVVGGDTYPLPPARPDFGEEGPEPAADPASYRCARCGSGDLPDDPLLPFLAADGRLWQHMRCSQKARG
jgi:hypothetical protein